jgi:hypothetical protein
MTSLADRSSCCLPRCLRSPCPASVTERLSNRVHDRRSGFDRSNINALGGEFSRTAGCRRVRKGVVAVRGEGDIDEASSLDEGAKLSFQESTGNSAGP